jgi:hypothetical protein
VQITVNEAVVRVTAANDTPLLWVLRDYLGMTGTKFGCGTLGNALIAIREENNRPFPDRSVTENSVATSTGLMKTNVGLIAQPVLGVILSLTGAQLALGSCDFSKNNGERFTMLATAAFALWNVGLAFVIGTLLHQVERRRWLRL